MTDGDGEGVFILTVVGITVCMVVSMLAYYQGRDAGMWVACQQAHGNHGRVVSGTCGRSEFEVIHD